MSDETDKRVSCALKLENGGMDDWFCIERATHDGRSWFERNEHGVSFMTSGRITNADIEGSSEEMREIAQAIRDRGEACHRRCSVRFDGQDFRFTSPRNSMYAAIVPVAVADALADDIEAELGTAEAGGDEG